MFGNNQVKASTAKPLYSEVYYNENMSMRTPNAIWRAFYADSNTPTVDDYNPTIAPQPVNLVFLRVKRLPKGQLR